MTLGAIVAPPDAAAATAILRQFELPRRTLVILEGESLLNDAAALLLFGLGTSLAITASQSATNIVPRLLLAIPGAILFGLLGAKFLMFWRPFIAGSLTGTIAQFVSTFGMWILAEHLKVSPVLTLVVFAMTLANRTPYEQTAKERVHSYSVWEAVVFILNVLAFLLMGLQARDVISRLTGGQLPSALIFALLVLALVITIRLVWVMVSIGISHRPYWIAVRKRFSYSARILTYREGIVISWCGMRGLVTIATALALPDQFPQRDLIVLSAFTVVLGTLVFQGLTLRWLIKLLRIPPDRSLEREICFARMDLLKAAVKGLPAESGEATAAVKAEYEAAEAVANKCLYPPDPTEYDRLRLRAITAQREELARLRREGRISDDAYHRIEEDLDWNELSAAPPGYFQWSET
jgi:CPA1 family monovalent cation:H+ antiporter